MSNKVGFIGLGIMGMPMARNLIKAGFELGVYNRTSARAETLADEGARKFGTPQALAAEYPVIITIVSDTPDVETVVRGECGVIEGIKPGSVVIDMSTISPQATRQMAHCLREKGVGMLDAPVSGGDIGARNATLSIMVGGEADDFNRCRPVLEAMGKNIVHVGPSGMGQTVKLMNQILVVGNLNAVIEALLFAQKSGADLEKAIDAVKDGAAGSWQLANLGPKITRRDFDPGFMVDLVQKDLRLVMEAAAAIQLPLPTTSYINQLYYALQATGEGASGTQVLAKALERISGVEIGGRD